MASTLRRCNSVIGNGRRPPSSSSEMSCARSSVKPPSMIAVPVVIGCRTTGAISSWPSKKIAMESVGLPAISLVFSPNKRVPSESNSRLMMGWSLCACRLEYALDRLSPPRPKSSSTRPGCSMNVTVAASPTLACAVARSSGTTGSGVSSGLAGGSGDGCGYGNTYWFVPSSLLMPGGATT